MKPTMKIVPPWPWPQLRRQEARAALAEAEAKACQAEELCQQKQNEAPGDVPGKTIGKPSEIGKKCDFSSKKEGLHGIDV